ncbi:MAG TPA: isochorismatase family protein [Acidobacteriaceae bacterium]|jgi:nicotinamidase-related amidase
MALTHLDEKSALIVIDLQKGITGFVESATEIVAKSAELARAFRAKGLPVVLVNVAGRAPGRTEAGIPKGLTFAPDWAELVPELGQQTSDLLMTKHRVGSFLGTNLDELLRERGVTQVFFTGIATGSGVESTARSAYDLGYNVVFVVDAMTDRDPEIHRHCVTKAFPKLGEMETTEGVLQVLRG